MAQLPRLQERWMPAAEPPPATRDVRTADPSADGRRSAAIFGPNCHRLGAYRLAAPGAILCLMHRGVVVVAVYGLPT